MEREGCIIITSMHVWFSSLSDFPAEEEEEQNETRTFTPHMTIPTISKLWQKSVQCATLSLLTYLPEVERHFQNYCFLVKPFHKQLKKELWSKILIYNIVFFFQNSDSKPKLLPQILTHFRHSC